MLLLSNVSEGLIGLGQALFVNSLFGNFGNLLRLANNAVFRYLLSGYLMSKLPREIGELRPHF